MKKTIWTIWTIALLLFVLVTLTETAVAQRDEPVITPPPEPTPFPITVDPTIEPPIVPPRWNFEGLKIEYQRVDVTIEDQVATTHIEQLFVNDNDWMLEGTYLFPLPEGAAVSQLTMWVNGNPIEAKILEKDEARQIYDTIVRQLRDPALLEYVGTSAIQANVFPIPPHDERRIEIEYTQILPAENGLIHYVYPQSTSLYTNTALDTQSIRVAVSSDEEIRAIYSPSHPVAISREGNFQAVAGYEAADVEPDKDFELYYSVSPEQIGLNLLTYREAGQDGFFLLLVAPSVEVEEVIAKDVILVMDTSGSMEGEKMVQAKEAARYVVAHLNPSDRFNIVAFSTGVRSYAQELVPAAAPGNYETFINGLEALGGTNISQALLQAVTQLNDRAATGQRPSTIIFLTDGLATEGIVDTPLLLDAVKEATPGQVRIFAFGVGNDVDPVLLDSLAQNHRGTATYVRPFEAIDEEVSGFYAKVSMPVLSDISLDFDDIVVEQMYPQTLPDLFAGTQLVLVGRYREGGPATITLRGTVNGRQQVFTYPDNTFRAGGGDEFIPRLWATRAIGHLLTEIRLHGEDPELVQSIVNLSIRYGIITPYTSYLIEEDDIFSQTARETIAEEAAGEEAMDSGAAAPVEEAAMSADLAEAEAPVALATAPAAATTGESVALEPDAVAQTVQLVGSKTFVLRDGVWIDTAYDADVHTPQQVGFASEAYFDLLSAAPEIGQYLALGQHVLVVYDDLAYEIVEGTGETAVTLPATPATVESITENPAEGPEEETAPLPTTSSTIEIDPEASTPAAGASASWLPWIGLLLGLLVVAGVGTAIARYFGK